RSLDAIRACRRRASSGAGDDFVPARPRARLLVRAGGRARRPQETGMAGRGQEPPDLRERDDVGLAGYGHVDLAGVTVDLEGHASRAVALDQPHEIAGPRAVDTSA